jgi:hypothetical protein
MEVELQGAVRGRGDSSADAEGETAKKRREDPQPPGEASSSTQPADVEPEATLPPTTAVVAEPPVGIQKQ